MWEEKMCLQTRESGKDRRNQSIIGKCLFYYCLVLLMQKMRKMHPSYGINNFKK